MKEFPKSTKDSVMARYRKPTFLKNGIVLDSPEPFPDEVSKHKIVSWIVFVIGVIIGISIGVGPIMTKVCAGIILGSVSTLFTHFFIVNGVASIKATQLNLKKYSLPYPISNDALGLRISNTLRSMGMLTTVNGGITKGLNVSYESLIYKVDIENKKGYFTVSFHYRVYLSTYICLIRDIPKIVYTIQQAILVNS